MKIIQISAISFEGSSDIFGLGEDNNVYHWGVDGEWKLDIVEAKHKPGKKWVADLVKEMAKAEQSRKESLVRSAVKKRLQKTLKDIGQIDTITSFIMANFEPNELFEKEVVFYTK